MAITLRGVSKRFGDKIVLADFSCDFPSTGCVALMGPSGCGKTTLLRLLAGLETPDAGEITLPPNAKLAYLFQEDRLVPALTAKGNVMAVLHHSDKATELLAERWLARVGLAGEEIAYPQDLSGGMKRRVAIARVLAFGGELLLLDEPFRGLDRETKSRMQELLLTGYDARRRLTILVTHDEEEALTHADSILRLDGLPLRIKE
jgi:NitT/TauT family transport system ATP-binding protein